MVAVADPAILRHLIQHQLRRLSLYEIEQRPNHSVTTTWNQVTIDPWGGTRLNFNGLQEDSSTFEERQIAINL